MELAVVSDLHLGAGANAETFGHDDGAFLRFLSFLESRFERIVLLGDIWDPLTVALPGDPAEGLRVCRAAHPEIARRFEKPKYTYIHGNHDVAAGPAEGVPSELSIQAGGTRILFTHGHEHDLIIRKAPWLSELGIWLGSWLLRMGLSPIYRTVDVLERIFGGASEDPTRCSFQRWAVELARHRAADVVVTGHTHFATRSEHGDRLFLNSGTCSRGELSFLSLDTKTGSYGVHKSW
jgi:predicted phosphodiesterase